MAADVSNIILCLSTRTLDGALVRVVVRSVTRPRLF